VVAASTGGCLLAAFPGTLGQNLMVGFLVTKLRSRWRSSCSNKCSADSSSAVLTGTSLAQCAKKVFQYSTRSLQSPNSVPFCSLMLSLLFPPNHVAAQPIGPWAYRRAGPNRKVHLVPLIAITECSAFSLPIELETLPGWNRDQSCKSKMLNQLNMVALRNLRPFGFGLRFPFTKNPVVLPT
jgi:hypothetical protein